MWIVDRLIYFAYWHGGELATILGGIWLILYSSFARRMTFEGEVAVKPEDRVFYNPTREMRLTGATIGVFVVLWGFYGSVTRHLHGFGTGFVIRHQSALSCAIGGISTILYVRLAKRTFETHHKIRLYVLALGVLFLCCSVYACIKGR